MPIVKSISFDQKEILMAIISLHTGPIQADVTYGSWCFYKVIPRPPFCWVDLFILLAKHRMIHPKHKVQKHARKYHSYFVVFQKR